VRDGDAGQQLPELLVVADRQQYVPRDDPVLLVVPRCIPRQLEDLKIGRRDEARRGETNQVFRVFRDGWGMGGIRLTSAARYSRTAERYTGAPAPTRSAYLPALRYRAMRPTGNCSPALEDRDTDLVAGFAFPRPPPPVELIDASLLGSGNFRTLRGWGRDGE